jgi:hypothetical protein
MAPNDDLDFVLKGQYDHHAELFKLKPETLVQPETLGLNHGRVLKNRLKVIPKEAPPLNHPLKKWQTQDSRSIHKITNAIVSHHTQLTNKGYSRKPDGGFYPS